MTNPFAPSAQPPAQPPAPTAPPAPPPAPAPAPTPTQNPFAMPAPQPQPPTQPQPQPPTQPSPQPQQQPGVDPFEAPAPQRARGPRLRDLFGRLVIIVPKRLEKGVRSQYKNEDGSVRLQDRLTMDLVVLDGGTIHYGGRPEDIVPVPHNMTAEVPAKFTDVYDSHAGIISQCRDALEKVKQGQPGRVLGRITVGEKKGENKPPFILTPYTDADRQIALAYLATVDPFV